MKTTKLHFKLAILSTLLIFNSLASAQPNDLAQDRFKPWLNILKNAFKPVNSLDKNDKDKFDDEMEKLIEKIPSTEVRVAAFNLQSLGELYSDQDKVFRAEIKSFAKSLEDTIGRLDYLKTVYKSTDSKKDRENLAKGVDNLRDLLLKDQWVVKPNSNKETRIQKMEQFLKNYSWKNETAESQQLLQGVHDQLERINNTEFDLSRLEKDREAADGTIEDGNGLHEMRRQIRWFLISARVLNGLISFKPNPEVCRINDYKDLYKTELATSKYSQLFENPEVKKPCQIEQCQFLALSDAANKLGEWKDLAEKDPESRETDSLPQEYLDQAEALRSQIHETGLLPELMSDVSSCLK